MRQRYVTETFHRYKMFHSRRYAALQSGVHSHVLYNQCPERDKTRTNEAKRVKNRNGRAEKGNAFVSVSARPSKKLLHFVKTQDFVTSSPSLSENRFCTGCECHHHHHCWRCSSSPMVHISAPTVHIRQFTAFQDRFENIECAEL